MALRFTCTKEHLDRALRYSTKALAKQSLLPIIQNVIISTENNILACAATNLDMGVRIEISGKIEEVGSVVIPPQLLNSFIASLDNGAQVTVSQVSDTDIAVESGSSRAVIKGYNPVDFPPIPQKENIYGEVTVQSDVFRSVLSRVMISVAKTEARPELTGVNIVFTDNTMRVAATDGFRLSESVAPIEAAAIQKDIDSIIVPASAIAEILYILSDSATKMIMMHISDGQIFFEVDGVTIVSRLISGTYPDYQQIIPQETATHIIVSRAECERVLRLADAFANNTTSDMKVTINPDESTCVISAMSQDRGENVTTLQVEAHGEVQEIYLNTRYVLDGISRCGSEKVRIAFSGAASPVVITPVAKSDDDERFLYLVMPIRK